MASKILKWGWSGRDEVELGEYLKWNIGSRKIEDDSTEFGYRYETVYEPVKIVKLNSASVRLENGDTVMAETGRARKSGTQYSKLREDDNIEAMRANASAYREERRIAREKEQERKRADKEDRRKAEAAERQRIAELNDHNLKNFQTVTLPDGDIMFITQLTNRYNETAVYMFTVSDVENRWAWQDDAPKMVKRVAYVSYEEKYNGQKEFYRRSKEEGATVYEALLNAIV